MITLVRDWSMVYLFGTPDGQNMTKRWGRVMWGIVVMDGYGKFKPDDYVCSGPVLKSSADTVHTRAGHVYSLSGAGNEIELPVTLLPRLRDGINPSRLIGQLPVDWKNGLSHT